MKFLRTPILCFGLAVALSSFLLMGWWFYLAGASYLEGNIFLANGFIVQTATGWFIFRLGMAIGGSAFMVAKNG